MTNPSPISDEHKAFAEKLVALCIDAGIREISATFSCGTVHYSRVTVTWSKGRPKRGPIHLRCEATDRIED